MENTLAYLKTLKEELHKSEAEIVALALETGLRDLMRERVLAKYLRGQVGRDEAIAAAGIDWVEMAERQRDAMQADLAWALKA